MNITVVGSGPNGLAAAVVCARAGLSVQVLEAQPTFGGGARSAADPEFDGILHDVCSAVHPLALGSPFFAEFDLRARGVRFGVPEISYANPLAGRPAAIAYRDLDRTCDELSDGASWRRLLGPLVEHEDTVLGFMLGDKRSLPRDLLNVTRLGLRILEQGTRAWNLLLHGDDAQALLTGVAAHAISRPPSLASSGAGMMLSMLAHTEGWPIPVGGTQAITDALIADLRAHGGEIHSDSAVTTPPSGVVLYDTAPTALMPIYRERVPSRYARQLMRYRFGPGAAKVDFVLSGDVPWSDERLADAPTLHLGGSRGEMARAEIEAAEGRHAARPMILAALPHLVDPARMDDAGWRPMWTYAHVPAGSTVDQTEAVTASIERFAPGFRDIVVAARSVPAAEMPRHNANYVGGDITVGGADVFKAVLGPTPRLDPWATPIDKVYLCSSATPPGAGVHGMAGYYAARSVLRREFGIREMPSLAPEGLVTSGGHDRP
ncbi:NAD(P)/FAD-dependent oxidoreductase [Mycobacterium manitobense]|uniref:NAD(P)/FAD-dependent oxidoreductase n=1 Tax=[Mycobacterium] manitobense TaxID=190147 RepID=A0A9X2YKU3_9MYCO|nr:NAD(P)/FAD-dependent oxidoreductase [[Mycobacterium] manitobense]MCV7169753.1 NAD(P)/FAD-dependent oxidoreductase [[Mycobacterium] manitobense]